MDVNFRFIGKMRNVTFCIEVRYDKIGWLEMGMLDS